jgi:hypothetical protein
MVYPRTAVQDAPNLLVFCRCVVVHRSKLDMADSASLCSNTLSPLARNFAALAKVSESVLASG